MIYYWGSIFLLLAEVFTLLFAMMQLFEQGKNIGSVFETKRINLYPYLFVKPIIKGNWTWTKVTGIFSEDLTSGELKMIMEVID